ncbi:unannotated protein [freshwater metagenome]|uniref:Unannotated protein n=1 Tax=freshwater metagenome TaxID=449393 RepID=A0A6J6IYX0_9ZZZZ|nr:LysM peptidoglycan-binding domain-containing protein [Actinomycetota bacterium]
MAAAVSTAIKLHPMSLKRRVRLSRTLFFLSGMILVIAGLAFNQSAVATDQQLMSSNAFNYVSVMPGDTLWELAQTYAEDKSQQDWIAEIILLNNLSSATLVAGDKLALP